MSKKQQILSAARTIFLEKGYSGSSVSQIAKQAGAAKSLVFHHFPNKEALWRSVKEELLSEVDKSDFSPITESNSVHSFIETIVSRRFNAYVGNPDLARLVSWQQLEGNADVLMGIRNFEADSWEDAVEDLQAKGLMVSTFPADIICSMIYGAISHVFFDNKRKLYNCPDKLQAYKDCVVSSLVKGLTL